MEQIKVGEYVRFNDGNFDKIIDIRDTLGERKLICFEKGNSYLSDTSLKNMQVKHSKNIIDLIEEGDYVNGQKIKRINDYGDFKRADFNLDYDDCDAVYEDDIKSIVTKEQFEAVKYEIK